MDYSQFVSSLKDELAMHLPVYMFSSFAPKTITITDYSICKEKVDTFMYLENTDDALGESVAMIDKYIFLPAGEYVLSVASVSPDKVIGEIASLMYYLSRGDVNTSYALINNLSKESTNILNENRFASPVLTRATTSNIKVKPCLL